MQRERALSETGRISAEEYSQVNQTVQNDIYADDCLLGEEENIEKALQRADEPKVANRWSSIDDWSINVAGMKWFPKEDLLDLDIGN